MNSADVDGTELVAEDVGTLDGDVDADTEEDGSGDSVGAGEIQTRLGVAAGTCSGVECSDGAASVDGADDVLGNGEGRDGWC